MSKFDFTTLFLDNIRRDLEFKYGKTRTESNMKITDVRNLIIQHNSNTDIQEKKNHPGTIKYDKTFMKNLINKMKEMNSKGFQIATSLSEVLFKVQAFITVEGLNPDRIFFRGQSNETHYMNSSFSRKKYSQFQLTNVNGYSYLTNVEKQNIDEFITHVNNNLARYKDIREQMLDQYTTLPVCDSANWWILKQHYDGGTRLIDISSSLFVALYFCVAKFHAQVPEIADPDEHGKLFIIQGYKDLGTLSNKTKHNVFDECRKEKLCVYESTLPHARPAKQRSYFLVDYDLKSKYDISNGMTLLIDKDSKAKILDELNILGINKDIIENGWRR